MQFVKNDRNQRIEKGRHKLHTVMKTDIWLQNPKDDGTSQAAKLFKNKYTIINESTVRTFVKKYDQNIKVAEAGGRSPVKKIQKFNMKETSNGWACHWRKHAKVHGFAL